jgi:ribosomal-protein-serine acetyltransferase
MFRCLVEDAITIGLLEACHTAAWFEAVERNRALLRERLGWLDHFQTLEHAQQFIQLARNEYAAGTGMKAAIWQHDRIIGGVSVQEIDWLSQTATVGVWLDTGYQGRGLATRCLSKLIEHLFAHMGINRVDVRCATTHPKSMAIPQRLGFHQEGVLRQSLWLYDHFEDEAIYSMLASRWPSHAVPG